MSLRFLASRLRDRTDSMFVNVVYVRNMWGHFWGVRLEPRVPWKEGAWEAVGRTPRKALKSALKRVDEINEVKREAKVTW